MRWWRTAKPAETRRARAISVERAFKRSLRPARLRYDNGYSSYLEVLDAELPQCFRPSWTPSTPNASA